MVTCLKPSGNADQIKSAIYDHTYGKNLVKIGTADPEIGSLKGLF